MKAILFLFCVLCVLCGKSSADTLPAGVIQIATGFTNVPAFYITNNSPRWVKASLYDAADTNLFTVSTNANAIAFAPIGQASGPVLVTNRLQPIFAPINVPPFSWAACPAFTATNGLVGKFSGPLDYGFVTP